MKACIFCGERMEKMFNEQNNVVWACERSLSVNPRAVYTFMVGLISALCDMKRYCTVSLDTLKLLSHTFTSYEEKEIEYLTITNEGVDILDKKVNGG